MVHMQASGQAQKNVDSSFGILLNQRGSLGSIIIKSGLVEAASEVEAYSEVNKRRRIIGRSGAPELHVAWLHSKIMCLGI